MSDLISSFKLIETSLDIDFQSYKQTFFSCKNNNSEIFQDCLERNAYIAKEMGRYSSSFREYLLRKKNRNFISNNDLN